jgi:hypothetical protein
MTVLTDGVNKNAEEMLVGNVMERVNLGVK